MQLHPLIVHFPIALRMVYCLILVVQLFWWRDNDKLNTIKHFCLIAGTVWGIAALQTGDASLDVYGVSHISHAHEERAESTGNLFVVLSLLSIYTLQPWTEKFARDSKIRKVISTIISHRAMALVGIIGMLLITIIGALGWAIARGDKADAISQFVVKVLVP